MESIITHIYIYEFLYVPCVSIYIEHTDMMSYPGPLTYQQKTVPLSHGYMHIYTHI